MGYFAHLADSQNLEDMDISVHCDIQVFDWLMRWIKYEEPAIKNTDNTSDNATRYTHSKSVQPRPVLNYSNAIPIMVSANFLQVNFFSFIIPITFNKAPLNQFAMASLHTTEDGTITRGCLEFLPRTFDGGYAFTKFNCQYQ